MKINLLLLILDGLIIVLGSPYGTPRNAPYKANVTSNKTATENRMNLKKLQSSTLHPIVQIIIVISDEKTGGLNYQRWTPSEGYFDVATRDIHIDKHNLSMVKATLENLEGQPVLERVVDGMKLSEKYRMPRLFPDVFNRSLNDVTSEPPVNVTSADEDYDAPLTVEIAIVCDLDFGKVFNFNRTKILEYWAVAFWDINMRFKTLPSSDISLRVTSITIITTPSGQPFIEDALVDGEISYDRVIELFGAYMYSQMGNLPKFDIAMAVTNVPVSNWGSGGFSYFSSACKVDHVSKFHMGVLVISDNGGYSSTTTAVHEIGHVLGAPHDEEIPGCEYKGYIMAYGRSVERQFYFSPCSDRAIQKYVNSSAAACLRSVPPLGPGFSSVETPTMTEQCQALRKNSSAFVAERHSHMCTYTHCLIYIGYGIWDGVPMSPLQNSPCTGLGRCFHGRCMESWSLVMNAANKKCIRGSNDFTYDDEPHLVDCPSSPTPLDKFIVLGLDSDSKALYLAMPYIITGHASIENDEKCLSVNSDNDTISFDRCDSPTNQKSLQWDTITVSSSPEEFKFVLQHRLTQKCVYHDREKLFLSNNFCFPESFSVWTMEVYF